MKITAVVVTYNRLELLKHGLECLSKQKQLSEIIVVNNGSTDGTTEWLNTPVREWIVINQANVGGSGGFYTGIKAAYDRGADWIWCMDDDVFPRPDCLDRLLKHTGEPDAGILSPRRILDGKVFTHEFRHFNFTNPLASMHGGKLTPSISPLRGRAGDTHLKTDNSSEFNEVAPSLPRTGEPEVVTGISIAGCDFEGPFINRRVVEAIGLPNKDLFIFCDDTDYCLRAHLAGFKLYYIPDALMDKHKFFSDDTWTTRNQKKKWKRYYQLRNETYMNHHYGHNQAVRYLRGLLGLIGYCIPALLSMPFTKAWTMHDLAVLWQAYKDGIGERLGKRQQ